MLKSTSNTSSILIPTISKILKKYNFIDNYRFVSSFEGLEPPGPSVKTEVPGPKTKSYIERLSKVQVQWTSVKMTLKRSISHVIYHVSSRFSKVILFNYLVIMRNRSEIISSMWMAMFCWMCICKSRPFPSGIIILK